MLACVTMAAAALPATGQPNILFVMTDDQGPWTPGYTGNPQSHTPNMDRLAREGLQFENAFVTTPVCSPSRAALISGRYASELGIPDWIRPDSTRGLPPEIPVWPRLIQAAGYRTGLVGKWHLGHATPDLHPTSFGYEYFMGLRTGGTSPKGATLEKDGVDQRFEGFTIDVLTDHAIEFISREDPRPFLLSLHYRAPHAAYLPVDEAAAQLFAERSMQVPDFPGLDLEGAKKRMREYLSSIAQIDRNLGRILDTLDAHDLTRDTLVIFTSDHGYNIGQHGIYRKGNGLYLLKETPPKRWPNIPANRRPNMFDSSLRVPLVVRWPGRIAAGTHTNSTVTQLDWFPTLCAAAGVSVPSDTVLRGKDMTDLFDGAAADWDDSLYAEYDMLHGAQTHMRVWRADGWKLMRDFKNPGRAEFYHLEKDPDERDNLIDTTDPEALAVLRDFDAKIIEKMREIGDSTTVSE